MISSVGESPAADARTKLVVLDGRRAANDCYAILFVCRDNSASSIMAEAILKRWGRKEFRAFSAGICPAGAVHPITVEMLKARGLWERSLQTMDCAEFLARDAPNMNFVICLGEERLNDLPAHWPGNPGILHWRITEPIVDGTPARIAASFKRTFGELENRIKLFILIYERERMKKVAA